MSTLAAMSDLLHIAIPMLKYPKGQGQLPRIVHKCVKLGMRLVSHAAREQLKFAGCPLFFFLFVLISLNGPHQQLSMCSFCDKGMHHTALERTCHYQPSLLWTNIWYLWRFSSSQKASSMFPILSSTFRCKCQCLIIICDHIEYWQCRSLRGLVCTSMLCVGIEQKFLPMLNPIHS